jgi:hypothetical protein
MRAAAVVTTLLLGTMLPTLAFAGDWKAILSAEKVQVANGKMTMEQFSLCKVTVPGATKSSLQMRTYAEAPVNAGISRDFLVAFQASTRTVMVLTMGSAFSKGTTVDALKALDCDPITAPIGKVDMEINLYMTADGFQMAVVNGATGTTTQESKRWEETLGGK